MQSTLPVSLTNCTPRAVNASRQFTVPTRRNVHALRTKALAEKALDFTGDEVDLDADSMYKAFDDFLEDARVTYTVGEKITGTAYSVDTKGAFVDFGGKQVGFLPIDEATLAKISQVSEVLKEGDKREFEIVRLGGRRSGFDTGVTVLSLKKVELEISWQRLRQMQENDIMLKGEVVGSNRGGYLLDLDGISAFLPLSQVANQSQKAEEIMGSVLPVKLIDVDETQERLVVSNRRAAVDGGMREFKVGSVVDGVVNAVKPFGAFVDVGGGVIGLLHVSQITHGRVPDITSILGEGDKLKVMVLSFDRIRRRVSLSTKKLEPTPGDMLKDPALVYAKADEMAKLFREQVALAEAQAKEEEERIAGDSEA